MAVISVLFSGVYWLIRHGAKALNNDIYVSLHDENGYITQTDAESILADAPAA